MTRRRLREAADVGPTDDPVAALRQDAADDAGAGDEEPSLAWRARDLAQRLANIIRAVRVSQHPVTASDLDVLDEVREFLAEVADGEPAEVQESRRFARGLFRPTDRSLIESHRRRPSPAPRSTTARSSSASAPARSGEALAAAILR